MPATKTHTACTIHEDDMGLQLGNVEEKLFGALHQLQQEKETGSVSIQTSALTAEAAKNSTWDYC